MSKQEKIAVVTGASGFLASHVVKKLIERGYKTRGTVRSLSDKEKVDQLKKVFPELELYEGDLKKPGSFDEVMKGANFVFHTASPFPSGEPKDPMKELVEPALEGTKTVLESALKAGTVEKLVLTSSVAAIAGKRPAGYVYTEEDWNLDSTPENEAYRYSKRVAEEFAWEFTKTHDNCFSLVVINPSFILGPPLSERADATSIKKVKAFFEGKSDKSCFGCVDVRDVSEAHVRAIEDPLCKSKRYMVSSPAGIFNNELAMMIKKSGKFPQYESDFPSFEEGPAVRLQYDATKVTKELGITYTPIQQTVVDMAQALIDLGIVAKK
eukprot:TRINITY_DN2770_c0_g1_i1.p1 TRINITY_DN2770_c0_g1~~TRINITY_DN2770_c0_g1_i1.p1  ORF type:complete len:324 (-),score=107.99 TRINITY_DN2770_c0_g1_i1:58-1029(-)